MIKMYQKVSIAPFRHISSGMGLPGTFERYTGIVVYINEKHQWFTVEYGNPKQRISYKFSDIGDTVQIIKSKEQKDGT